MNITFLCIGDIHHQFNKISRIAEWSKSTIFDAVLFVGDFNDIFKYPNKQFSRNELLIAIKNNISNISNDFYFVPGNHDQRMPGIKQNIDGKVISYKGLTISGLGGSPSMPIKFPYAWEDEDFSNDNFPISNILLSHTPPYNSSLDLLSNNINHVGSKTVRKNIGKYNVIICGHVHESSGIEIIDNTLCMNTGELYSTKNNLIQFGILRISDNYANAELRWINQDNHSEIEKVEEIRW